MKKIIVLVSLVAGCAFYQDYELHGIPNFQVVDEYVARGGQPKDKAACEWLITNGYTEWEKFSYEHEASSKPCESVGIKVNHFEMPPSDVRDFVERPALSIVKAAVAALLKCRAEKRKCFGGCLHGRDRTGLMTALYLWLSGEMDKATAWIVAAIDRGFRVFYHELSDTYEDFKL
jgi:hypothetical protein